LLALQRQKAYNKSLKLPRLAAVKVSVTHVEFHFESLHRGVEGPTQRFNVKHIRTGFGSFRCAFYCNTCGKPVVRLYYYNNSLLCRWCCNGRHGSQAISRQSRPALQINRITDFLSSKSRLLRRTRERLTKRLGAKVMRAQGQLGTDARPLWE
jgi:hypothetical protein